MISKHDITGLILAGGRGRRMNGVDKGLQSYRGQPLAMHALQRLAPQVGKILISANRNAAVYQAMGATLGAPALRDTLPGYEGPLAGFLTGLEHCDTPYLATTPCDCPHFPANLVERLADALVRHDAEVAVAASLEHGAPRPHPVFCLLRTGLRDSLRVFMAAGERRVSAWTAQHRRVEVLFDNPDNPNAFSGANTLDELRQL